MGSEKKVFSMKDVEQHNGENDVWMVIHNHVYDVTKFMDEHPGGEEVLRDVAGKEATDNFEDVGHSTDAREMMKDYEIGELAEEDRKKTRESPLTWGGQDGASNGLVYWILPLGAAVLVALLYRYYSA